MSLIRVHSGSSPRGRFLLGNVFPTHGCAATFLHTCLEQNLLSLSPLTAHPPLQLLTEFTTPKLEKKKKREKNLQEAAKNRTAQVSHILSGYSHSEAFLSPLFLAHSIPAKQSLRSTLLQHCKCRTNQPLTRSCSPPGICTVPQA